MDEVSLGLFADLVRDRRIRVTQMQTGGTVRSTSCEHGSIPIITQRAKINTDLFESRAGCRYSIPLRN